MNKTDEQYNTLCNHTLKYGVMEFNERTGKKCLKGFTTVFVYDVGSGLYPIITSRKAFPKMTLAEPVGYMQGLTSAADFRALGTKTWDANANQNESWNNNPHRTGEDDMGKVYGYFGHNFGGINQFLKVYENLKNGIDDRGEIVTYWKPDDFDKGCLRPCLHSFQFNLLGDTLHMTATQRSCDIALGLVANMQQVYQILAIMARITGKRAGLATHVINQPHIYEDQIVGIIEQMGRTPVDCFPKLIIDDTIQTWEDVMNIKNMDVFEVVDYQCHEPIKYPFSV